jgi:hypothetical protein
MEIIDKIIGAFQNPGAAGGATILGIIASYLMTLLKKVTPKLDALGKWPQRGITALVAGALYLIVSLSGVDLPLNIVDWTQGDMTVFLTVLAAFFTHQVRKESGGSGGTDAG